jgi:hypothetical protein
MKDLVAELTPAGVVSGAIVDNDRQPLEGVTVQLMRAGYTSSGRRLFPVGGAVKSDDRGQYRIFFVAPGRYYVHAGTPLKGAGIDLSTAFNSFPETYSAVYFPGAANLQFATPVDVLPGTALSGVDFTLSKARGVRVRGSVVDATTGMPPENNPSIWLSLRDPAGEDYTLDLTGRGKVSYSRNGTFEFRDVPPGSYGLIATALAPGETLKATRLAPERAGSMSLEVGNSDIEGLVVTLAPGGSIPGRIRVEGRADIDLTTFFASGTKSVGFVPWFGGGQSLIPGASLLAWAEIKPDGIFRIENVMPGEHRVDVSVLRPGMYIKEARFGLTDILAEPFRFNGRDTGNLEIVLSPNVSSLDGIVTDGRASAAPEAQVVLIPKRSRHRTDLFKTVATDQDGRFALTNLAPGEYTLYAWEAIESNRWFDPDFVSADEQYGQSIQLSESSRHSVTLRLIPARNP